MEAQSNLNPAANAGSAEGTDHSVPVAQSNTRRTGRWIAGIAAGALALLLIAGLVAGLLGSAGYTMYRSSGNVAPERQPAGSPTGYEGDMDVAGGTGGNTTSQGGWDRMIIRSGNMAIEVASVENSIAAVRDVAAQAGGIVFSSNSQYQGDSLLATVTIQVPAERFDSVMSDLRKLGVKVLNEATTSQDVTEEYTDLSSQLKNLQATEEQLRLLMTRAEDVEDTLAVQHELSTVRGEIEQIQGRLNYLSRRAELSTIVVSLVPKPLAVAYTSGWDPAVTVERAWASSLEFLKGAADLMLTVAVFLWWLVPVGLAAWLLLRGRLASRRERTLDAQRG